MHKIAKVDEARGWVFGWANHVLTADGEPIEDLQGDIIDADELEMAAVDFFKHSQGSGVMHDPDSRLLPFIESFVCSPEKLTAMGFPESVAKQAPTGHWVGVDLSADRDTFERVRNGELAAFSIEGTARRVEV